MAERPEEPTPHEEVRLPRREALRLHVTLAIGLALCVAAFWFELSRALGGNALSWAYVFEWPLLGGFAFYMWWQLLHPGRNNRLNRKVKSLDPSFNGMLERWEEARDDLDKSRDAEDESAGP